MNPQVRDIQRDERRLTTVLKSRTDIKTQKTGAIKSLEGFQNLSRNPDFRSPSKVVAQNSQNFRQQGALNNGFTANDFRLSGGF